ncbi:hypothetical protein LDENG_00259670, partial [Lucifuga dentata]
FGKIFLYLFIDSVSVLTKLKDHTTHFSCLSLIYSVFIHVTLLTIISQKIKPYFSFPDILQNLLIFQNQIFK